MEHRTADPAEEPRVAPEPPAAAVELFGPGLPLARRYADHLADTGVSHGLIGPREVPRLWERHLLNCALLTDLLPEGAEVADIGSGAGLPGIALALRRPDLSVTLVEPLLRRVTWLEAVVSDLGLTQVAIRRARAEELAGELSVPFVTARAVAALDQLVRWGAPLLTPGGHILALKGRTAGEELAEHTELLTGWRIDGEVVALGVGQVEEPTQVVRLRVPEPARVSAGGRGRPSAKRSTRRARRHR